MCGNESAARLQRILPALARTRIGGLDRARHRGGPAIGGRAWGAVAWFPARSHYERNVRQMRAFLDNPYVSLVTGRSHQCRPLLEDRGLAPRQGPSPSHQRRLDRGPPWRRGPIWCRPTAVSSMWTGSRGSGRGPSAGRLGQQCKSLTLRRGMAVSLIYTEFPTGAFENSVSARQASPTWRGR